MVTLDEVAAMALALPEVEQGERWGRNSWTVRTKVFAWEREFSKADIRRFGTDPVPAGPIVAVRVDGIEEKEAVLAAGPKGFFTIPHFDGYAAVLIQLKVAGRKAVREAIEDAWLACAPPALAEAWVADRKRRR